MATSRDYFLFVLDLLREVNGITYRKMMGEYILYKDDVIIGGIYDDRFLLKKSKSLSKYNLSEVIPYPSAKPMYLVDSEDPDEVKELVLLVYNDLR